MKDKREFERHEQKELPKDATTKEKLKYIRDLAIFTKSMFGDISYNDMHLILDEMIEVSND